MSRLVPLLCAACAVGIGLTAWSQLDAGTTNVTIPKGEPAPKDEVATDASAQLRKARMACTVAALDSYIAVFSTQATAKPSKELWHNLAEAYLERALQRTHLHGMAPGAPTFEELPTDFAGDLKAGLEAVAKARELGDETGELFRIEAGLMSQHITGWRSALAWNGKIAAALATAVKRVADDPQVHVALGLRKLFAPTWLGNDPAKALEHFEFADKADGDERPAVFAAMASYLQKKRQQAITWLERAVAKNPDNKFARVVLGRLRRGEDNPFARNVTEAELAAGK
ncbi:MAG: tetratricopeptide (TPR) repeat protein [Planctomycetota bacterium]|jgi:tetratricopeptide (TPR) repeat protein